MCRNPAAYGQATATRMCSGDWSCEVGLQVEARGPGHDTSRFLGRLVRRTCTQRSRRERTTPHTACGRTTGREREAHHRGEGKRKRPQEGMGGEGRRCRMNGNGRRVPGPPALDRVPMRDAFPDVTNGRPTRDRVNRWTGGRVHSFPEATGVKGTVVRPRPADGRGSSGKPMRGERRGLFHRRDRRGRSRVFAQLTALHLARERAEGSGIAAVRVLAHRRLRDGNARRSRSGAVRVDLAHLASGLSSGAGV